MKIHSDILINSQVYGAATAGGMRGVYVEDCTMAGSRSRKWSFNVTLRGNSTRRPNPGTRPGGHYELEGQFAATWDEWGMYMQGLYEIDPKALIGQYGTYETFVACTFGRFESLTAPFACPTHKWLSLGDYVTECKWCGARFDYKPMNEIMLAKRAAQATA